SALKRHGVEPPQEISSLELQLVDVAALVGDREVEARVLAGPVHPAGVHAGDAVLASPALERHGGDRAAMEIGANGHGFVEGLAAHVRDPGAGPGRARAPALARYGVGCPRGRWSGPRSARLRLYCTSVQYGNPDLVP